MKSKLFVFIGMAEKNSSATVSSLHEGLDELFKKNELTVQFTRKDELLSARLNDVAFYASVSKNKKELKDWFKLAVDFNLKLEKNPVTMQTLEQRYNNIRILRSSSYNEIHFGIATTIMQEMEKFKT